MRKRIWISLIVILILVGVAMLFVHTAPPHSMTYASMHMCKRRILRYAREHGQLPPSLDVTQPIEGYHTSIKDAWGLAIDYHVNTDGTVTLRSLGRDRQAGGTDDNLDMIGVFPSRRLDGSWSDELVEWSQYPFDPLRMAKSKKAIQPTGKSGG